MIKVLFVCLGNICRSPMAEFIFKDLVNKKGLSEHFYIDSAATSNYNEIRQNGLYDKTKEILIKKNIYFTEHISKQIKKEDYKNYDYILAMDDENIVDIKKIIEDDKENKIYKFLYFTGNSRNVIDPWYSGDFESAYLDIKLGCDKFLEYIINNAKIDIR